MPLKLSSDFNLDTPNVIKFQLLDSRFNYFTTEFNLTFGFVSTEDAGTSAYKNSLCNFVDSFEPRSYQENTQDDTSL